MYAQQQTTWSLPHILNKRMNSRLLCSNAWRVPAHGLYRPAHVHSASLPHQQYYQNCTRKRRKHQLATLATATIIGPRPATIFTGLDAPLSLYWSNGASARGDGSAAVPTFDARPTPAIQVARLTTSCKSRSERQVDKSVVEDLKKYARFRLNPKTLEDLVEFGKVGGVGNMESSIEFLANEASVRLAHIIVELQSLPKEYLKHELIHRIYLWYTQSFVELVELKRQVPAERLKNGTKVIQRVLRRHEPVVMTMALGLRDLRAKGLLRTSGSTDGSGRMTMEKLTSFLDGFYMNRIAIRFLFNQHLQLFASSDSTASHLGCPGPTSPSLSDDLDIVGSIEMNCDVGRVARDAAAAAQYLCNEQYGDRPEVEIVLPATAADGSGGGADAACFTYVPSHVYHILFELLKNSCRAVTEFHDEQDAAELPPVKVIIMLGDDDLTIKVEDRGGGIEHAKTKELFTYFYSTATVDVYDQQVTDMNHAPLAGFGYGLPVSRLYARYFGGDLNIMSVQGYGTDAYVHLCSTPANAEEELPAALAVATAARWNASIDEDGPIF